jgi:hypothetical protein
MELHIELVLPLIFCFKQRIRENRIIGSTFTPLSYPHLNKYILFYSIKIILIFRYRTFHYHIPITTEEPLNLQQSHMYLFGVT